MVPAMNPHALGTFTLITGIFALFAIAKLLRINPTELIYGVGLILLIIYQRKRS
jgi:hypothetical protein